MVLEPVKLLLLILSLLGRESPSLRSWLPVQKAKQKSKIIKLSSEQEMEGTFQWELLLQHQLTCEKIAKLTEHKKTQI